MSGSPVAHTKLYSFRPHGKREDAVNNDNPISAIKECGGRKKVRLLVQLPKGLLMSRNITTEIGGQR